MSEVNNIPNFWVFASVCYLFGNIALPAYRCFVIEDRRPSIRCHDFVFAYFAIHLIRWREGNARSRVNCPTLLIERINRSEGLEFESHFFAGSDGLDCEFVVLTT